MAWQIASVGRLYAPGEASAVYYDPASGDTHLISEFTAYLIGHFKERPLGLAELIDQISSHVSAEARSDLADTLPGILEELVALDILKQV